MDKKAERTKIHDARIWMIIGDICAGLNNLSLYKKYKDDWKISRTGMTNLINEAYEMMKIGDEEYLENLRQINIKRLEDLYTDALASNDKANALKAMDLINKTAGLYTTKVELGGNTSFKYVFADEEVSDNQTEENNG